MFRAECIKGLGATAMKVALHPISAHVEDAFEQPLSKRLCDHYRSESRVKREFEENLSSPKQIKSDPRLVLKGMAVLFEYRFFVYDTTTAFTLPQI